MEPYLYQLEEDPVLESPGHCFLLSYPPSTSHVTGHRALVKVCLRIFALRIESALLIVKVSIVLANSNPLAVACGWVKE